MRVLFWGTPEFSLPALRALTGEGHDVVGVVTQPDRPAGRGQQLAMSPVKQAASADDLPILQPERARGDDLVAAIRELDPEISIVVAYGQILPRQILALPQHGSLNIHASLLPELRGAAPVHWAIIRGLEVTGVTIMQMEEELDAGPILHSVAEPIRADESTSELSMRLSEIGAEALVEALAMIEAAGEIPPEPQDASRATYAPKIERETAHLDWSLPAVEVARWIRGLDAVPGAWSTVGGGTVKLFDPRVEVHQGDPGVVLDADPEVGILIAAGHEAVRVREVQPAGKRRMTAGDWARGRGVRIGDRLA
jgi:methionyl-tRNA formyltransferase